jgi:hypothetical protein
MALYTVPKAVLVKVFEQQPQHWQGNSSKATTLHTATALVVNLPVKVKARTSNGYVQNVTRCPLKHNKICKICFKNSKS